MMNHKWSPAPVVSFLVAVVLIFCGPVMVEGVVLKKDVEVDIPPFTLEDITSHAPDEGMAGIKLGSLPKPGQSRFISQAYIRMQARLQGKPVPSFEGSVNQVTVSRPSRQLTSADIRGRVKKLLVNEFSITDRVDVEVLEIPGPVEVLPGDFSLRLDGWNPYRSRRGTTWYRIAVDQRGTETTRFRAKASMTQENRVPVAAKPIARNQKINSELIKWETRDISRLRGNIITRKKEVLGFKAKQSFKPGDVITRGKLEKPILVERRSPITIVHRKNGLTITTRGTAMEKGARGDRIMVKNRSSEVQLQAEVINERRVLIQDGK